MALGVVFGNLGTPVKTIARRLISSKTGIIILILLVYTGTMAVVAVFNLVKLHEDIRRLVIIDLDYNKLHEKFSATEPALRNILTGEKVTDRSSAWFIPFSVILDNHSPARPQFGLAESPLVFEIPVEGDITRLLAFYEPGKRIDKIGPVRSVRPYFIDFAGEFRALLAHSGGSAAALQEISKQIDVLNLDEIGPEGRYFWRANNHLAPHNLYTSSALLEKAYEALHGQRADIDPAIFAKEAWQYQEFESTPVDEHEQKQETAYFDLEILYSPVSYIVRYGYDRGKETYTRFVNEVEQRTPRGGALSIDNVLVAMMSTQVLDTDGRLAIETRGEGDAFICTKGMCEKGKWEKGLLSSRIQFLIGKEPALLKPGVTWVHIVPESKQVIMHEVKDAPESS